MEDNPMGFYCAGWAFLWGLVMLLQQYGGF
jgi:hypothetical protein